VIEVRRARPVLYPVLAALCSWPAWGSNLEERIVHGTFRGREVEYVSDVVLIKVRASTREEELTDILEHCGARLTRPVDIRGIAVLKLVSGIDPISVIPSLERHPEILWAEPDIVIRPHLFPNDAYFDLQWNLHNTGQSPTYGLQDADIDAPEAWDFTTGSNSVIIGILDSGIALENGQLCHSDLNDPSKIILGNDYTGDGEGVKDNSSHGTHVAGIAAAESDNSIGISGVAWNPRILIQQVFSGGGGSWSWFYSAVIDAIDIFSCDVINFSGGGGYSLTGLEAVTYADAQDCVIVASAGNSGGDVSYPAAFAADHANVISVGATDPWDQRPSWSCHGSNLCVMAPGGTNQNDATDIYSTIPQNSYGWKGGTSMAAPHVAGLAALMLSVFPNLPDSVIRERIEDACDDLGAPGWDPYYGHGRISAHRTIHTLLSEDTLAPEVELIHPNGGEILSVGHSYEIVWEAWDDQGILNQFLYFSSDDGDTWDSLAALDGSERSYIWAVPYIRSNQCRVKVECWDWVNVGVDMSDQHFKIIPGVMRLIHPTRKGFPGTSVQEAHQRPRSEAALYVSQPNPSPFRTQTQLTYSIQKSSRVRIDICDISGHLIATLQDEDLKAGSHSIAWDGTCESGEPIQAGVFFFRIQSGEAYKIRKVLFLK
jgi:thermitase